MIGTGSSAVQSIPVIAKQAREVHVFQRTATYSVPAHNAALDPAYAAQVKADYCGFRARNELMPAGFGSNLRVGDASALVATAEECEAAFAERWRQGGLGFTRAFGDILLNDQANALAAGYVRRKIAALVKDQATADLLAPTQPVA